MSVSFRTLSILSAVTLLGAFAAGRFTAPEKVRIETRTVEIHTSVESEKKSQDVTLDRDQHHEVVVTELVLPNGTRKTTTRTVTDRQLKQSVSLSQEFSRMETVAKEAQTLKEVTAQSRSKLELSLLVGPSVSFSNGVGPLVFGIHVSRPLIGPVTTGLWAISSGAAGVSLGLQF